MFLRAEGSPSGGQTLEGSWEPDLCLPPTMTVKFAALSAKVDLQSLDKQGTGKSHQAVWLVAGAGGCR